MKNPMESDHAAMPGDLKRLNRQRILQALRSGRIMTANAIHRETGISRPTVMRALQHFCQIGAVKSLGQGDAAETGGKRPERFVFADPKQILCIILWPEAAALALCGMMGGVNSLETIDPAAVAALRDSLDPLPGVIQRHLTDHQLRLDDLYGMVVIVPGVVDYERKVLRYNAKSPEWGTEIPLAKQLEALFGKGLRYCVDNDGKAAGRAVLHGNPEYADWRLMTFFTARGVSACMMERGHVLCGRDSLIGEVGHMIISDTGPEGGNGFLETLVSIEHVRQMTDDPDMTFEKLFALSQNGEEQARKAVGYLAHCFAVVLHNLSLCYNQEAVVFLGDFAMADQHFDQCLRREINRFRYRPGDDPFSIEYDRRDPVRLAACGGAELLRKQYFQTLE